MWRFKTVPEFILIIALPLILIAGSADDSGKLYSNGLWFDGKGFHKRDTYVVNGVLTLKKPEAITETTDLKGRYVIHAFGDAHQHNFNSTKYIDEDINRFLSGGTFYVMVQDAIGEPDSQILNRMNQRESVDVSYTWAPLIGPRHGLIDYFSSLAKQSAFGKDRGPEQLDGYAYFLINNKEDLDKKWKQIADKKIDFIKVILAFSEEDHRRRTDESFYTDQDRNMARPGVHPSLLDEIVKRAHRQNKRVSVHVETAADFRVAINARADMIAHLPGWHLGPTAGFTDILLDHWLIPAADAKLAADRKISVVTTTSPKPFLDNVKLSESFRSVHRKNLNTLKQNHVSIAIGADNSQLTAVDEALHLSSLSVFDNAEILKMLSETTPRLIFPKRNIGCLNEGCEASFVVLEHNPITNLEGLKRISLRVKSGIELKISSPSKEGE
jgi:hypothetical protein